MTSWLNDRVPRYLPRQWLPGNIPDSKVHGANMGPTRVLSAPGGPHVGPMNLAIRDALMLRLASGGCQASSWWRHQMETFPRYWPFVRGIHRSPVNSPHKGQWARSFDVSFDLRPHKRLSKQWWGWLYETLSCPLWLHGDVVRGWTPALLRANIQYCMGLLKTNVHYCCLWPRTQI